MSGTRPFTPLKLKLVKPVPSDIEIAQAADIKPIAHLYKTQVYQLGRYYGLPEEIINRPPTSDTYSLPQSQEEFYFSLPYDKMDLALYGYENEYPAEELSRSLDIPIEQAEGIYQDISSKKRIAQFLQTPPIVLGQG